MKVNFFVRKFVYYKNVYNFNGIYRIFVQYFVKYIIKINLFYYINILGNIEVKMKVK